MIESVVKEQYYLGLLETCEVQQVGRNAGADRSMQRHSRFAGLLGLTAACRDTAGWQECWG
jgi:hypothetical protein